MAVAAAPRRPPSRAGTRSSERSARSGAGIRRSVSPSGSSGTGRFAFHGGGLADIARRAPVTEETAFRIASVTKLFTAIAVMQLCEAGLRRPRRAGHDLSSCLPAGRQPALAAGDGAAPADPHLGHPGRHPSGRPAPSRRAASDPVRPRPACPREPRSHRWPRSIGPACARWSSPARRSPTRTMASRRSARSWRT